MGLWRRERSWGSEAAMLSGRVGRMSGLSLTDF